MSNSLRRPYDPNCPEFEAESVVRLKDRREFNNPSEWALYQAKVFYEGLGDTQKAIDILEQALPLDSENLEMLESLAECYSREPNHFEKALEYCQKALAVNSSADHAYTVVARVQAAQGNLDVAYQAAIAALKLNSRNVEAGIYLGVIGFAMAMGNHDLDEMEWSIKNLRLTQSLIPQSKRLAAIIAENERVLADYQSQKAKAELSFEG